MAASSVTVRVDSETKREAAAIAEYFGLDLSSVTRAFYKQIVRERRIPISLEDPQPNAESLESIREADEIIAKGGSGFASAAEMFEEMGV